MGDEFLKQLVWALRGLQRLAEARGYPSTARKIELARIEAEKEFAEKKSADQAIARLRKLKAFEADAGASPMRL